MSLDQKLDEFNVYLEGVLKKLEEKKVQPRVVKRTSINLVPAGLIMSILWGMGVIVAKGFWATLAAIFIPFIGPAISVLWLVERFSGAS